MMDSLLNKKYTDRANQYCAELLSKYPAKEISLEEARTLFSTRLKDRSLTDVIRDIRDEKETD